MHNDIKHRIRLSGRKVLASLVFVVWLFPTMGCYRIGAYKGDGKIVAVRVGNWLMNCTYFEVSLGSINLTNKSKKAFTLQGLPHEEMCLGFRTKVADDIHQFEKDKSDAVVRVLLVDGAEQIVIDEEDRLTRWVWSFGGGDSFMYQRGELHNEREIAGVIDEAHGTYFKPRTNAKYTLTVEIIESDSKGRYDNVKLEIANLCP